MKDGYPEQVAMQTASPASHLGNEGIAPSCAGKPNCSCGCGTEAASPQENPEPEEEQLEDQMEEVSASMSRLAASSVSAPAGRRSTSAPPPLSNGMGGNGIRRNAPPRLPHSPEPRSIAPSACADGNCGAGGIVYALGEFGYDFSTQARFDAIAAEMDEGASPNNPLQLLEFLQREGNAHFAASIIWTLNHDLTPIYAVRPEGPYAKETYARILLFYADQIQERAQRASVPGIIDGTVMLQSGQSVPVVLPELRGMYSWTTEALVKSMMAGSAEEKTRGDTEGEIRNFLERVYYDVRNMGQLPEERALNFAATNAFNIQRVFEDALRRSMQLDEIGVERSPVCRPDSDCWDIRLVFFNPEDVLGSARQVYRFTADVSDLVPVLVGPVRTWAIR